MATPGLGILPQKQRNPGPLRGTGVPAVKPSWKVSSLGQLIVDPEMVWVGEKTVVVLVAYTAFAVLGLEGSV